MILAVAQKGEQILQLHAAPVTAAEFGSAWLKHFSSAMQATMLERQGVGIAAPQVYLSKRIIIVASRPNARYPDAPVMSPILMINPEILAFSSQTTVAEEGCLSVANQRGQVERAHSIEVRYCTLEGEVIEQQFSGFPARIVQHELDHLNGILFVERLAAIDMLTATD